MTATADTTTPDATSSAEIVKLAERRPKPPKPQPQPRQVPTPSTELVLLAALIVALDERKTKRYKGMKVRAILQTWLRAFERAQPDEPVYSQAVAFVDRLADARLVVR